MSAATTPGTGSVATSAGPSAAARYARRRGAPALALAVALLLSACAAKPPSGGTRVTLLPQEDGTPSAVIVRSANAEERLSVPYQTATARTGQPPVVQQAQGAQVRQDYAPLFAAAPPKPVRFVLYFQTATTQLTTESQAALGQVLAETLSRSGAEIVLIGHTDTKGKGDYNDALSLQRAQQVRELFLQRRFPAGRIEATGRGERDLAVPTRDEVDEVRNRRVEILVR